MATDFLWAALGHFLVTVVRALIGFQGFNVCFESVGHLASLSVERQFQNTINSYNKPKADIKCGMGRT